MNSISSYKKAISPVVATSLLLVVAVSSVVFFQNWFTGFSSQVLTEVETDSQTSQITSIEGLIGDNLYIQAGNNLTINRIQIEGNDCMINTSISGLDKIDISSCIENISKPNVNILVVTDKGIFESYKIISKLVSNSESQTPQNTVFTPQVSFINELSFPPSCGSTRGLYVDSNKLFAMCPVTDIFYSDITNINSLSVSHKYSDQTSISPSPSGNFVYANSNYVLSSVGGNNLNTFDISSNSFVSVSQLNYDSTGNSLGEFIVKDNVLYSSDYNSNKIYSFDISDLTSITKLDEVQNVLIDWPEQLRIVENYLFVNHFNNNEVIIFDISNPNSLTQLHNYGADTGGWGSSLATNGNYTYVCSNSGTFETINTTNKNSINFVKIQSMSNLGTMGECDFINNYLVSVSSTGIGMYNVSSSGDLNEILTFSHSIGNIEDIHYEDNYLFVNGGGSIKIFDLFLE